MTAAPIVVIQCGKAKLEHAAPARDLYVSQPFKMARAAVERDGRPWLILSARHGLISPDRILAPYDRTLNSRTHKELLARWVAGHNPPRWVESWCGRNYEDVLRLAGVRVEDPLAGLRIGERLAWFSGHAAEEAMA